MDAVETDNTEVGLLVKNFKIPEFPCGVCKFVMKPVDDPICSMCWAPDHIFFERDEVEIRKRVLNRMFNKRREEHENI